jgi:hypothetical protein
MKELIAWLLKRSVRRLSFVYQVSIDFSINKDKA